MNTPSPKGQIHEEIEKIFRTLLPQNGLAVREEQVALCHIMLDALLKNNIALCDAGVGIGKTYAYLTACILLRKNAPHLPIYHTVAESSLQKGAGHMPGTSLPIGGKSTHAVISAHSGMSDARMFTDLDKVQKGNLILLHVLGDTLAYAVDTITVTDPADIEAIEIRQDKDLVTLVTCTPYSVNTHRLLVRGHRIELTEEEITEETKATEPEASTWMEKYIEGIFFGFIIGGAVLVLVRALSKKVRENQ